VFSLLAMEPYMDKTAQREGQLATWWQAEKERDFTRLECGLLGALFAAIGIGFIITIGALIG
jgi:hypothetical protein